MRNNIKKIWMVIRFHVFTIQTFEMREGYFFDIFKVLMSGILFLDLGDGVETFPGLSLFVEKGRVPISCFEPKTAEI